MSSKVLLLLAVFIFVVTNDATCCTSVRTKARAEDISSDSSLWRKPKLHSDSKTREYDRTEEKDSPYFVKKNDSYSFRWDLFLAVIGIVLVVIPLAMAAGFWIYRRLHFRNQSRGHVTKTRNVDV